MPRTYRVVAKNGDEDKKATIELRRLSHHTTKRVINDMKQFKYNTAISALMELTSVLYRLRAEIVHKKQAVGEVVWDDAIERLLLHLAPLAPYMAEELCRRRRLRGSDMVPNTVEELWSPYEREESIHLKMLPEWVKEYAESNIVTVAVQINGKLRGTLELGSDEAQDEKMVFNVLRESDVWKRWVDGNKIKRQIYVKSKLLNLVVEPSAVVHQEIVVPHYDNKAISLDFPSSFDHIYLSLLQEQVNSSRTDTQPYYRVSQNNEPIEMFEGLEDAEMGSQPSNDLLSEIGPIEMFEGLEDAEMGNQPSNDLLSEIGLIEILRESLVRLGTFDITYYPLMSSLTHLESDASQLLAEFPEPGRGSGVLRVWSRVVFGSARRSAEGLVSSVEGTRLGVADSGIRER